MSSQRFDSAGIDSTGIFSDDGVAAMDHELQIKCNELLKRIKHLQDSL